MVTAGTHLERLYQLRKKVDQEIAIEEQRRGVPSTGRQHNVADRGFAAFEKPPDRRGGPQPQSDMEALAQLGITTRDVRKWAEAEGLIPPGGHGRIKTTVIEAYGEAHQ